MSDPSANFDDSDVAHLRSRVHKLADIVQNHEGTLREHQVRLDMNAKQIEVVRQSSATVEQLTHTGELMKQTIRNTEDTLKLRIDNVVDELKPIKSGVYWAVTLIIGAVLLAIMTMLLNGAPPKP